MERQFIDPAIIMRVNQNNEIEQAAVDALVDRFKELIQAHQIDHQVKEALTSWFCDVEAKLQSLSFWMQATKEQLALWAFTEDEPEP